MEWSLWEAIIRIIVCLPLVLLLAYILIKYGVAKNYAHNRGNLRLLEQVVLQPKGTLNIVKAGDEYLLISATEHEINVIKPLENYQEAEPQELQLNLNDTLNRIFQGKWRQ
ncbi:MAG: flagellar biosynthetic protein FliO [Syntrophomonadaceae bacterium]|nr:flagellar biosynthetic protein FliO [Syntrophomonadaceae bacterium]